jgi:TolB-like protein/class 3 adenylate cyclase
MDTPRKLAAILAADIVGYSRLMGLDEAGTATALREHRVAIDPVLARHGGRVFKTTGDGVLVEFPSIVAAVASALAVQKLMAERNADVPEDRRMLFRIGINLGDVLIDGDDLLGDGVNVAARLEGIAEPGGICISDDSYRQVRGKLDVAFEDAGEQQLKNISRPVRTYRVRLDGVAPLRSVLPLPSKPSIAVLPFQNMSDDPGQDYFADGMVEDIITALSRVPELFVISRSSSFTYKGRAVDVKQVGRELGVRYVLEGSVRKAGNLVRITGQLINATTGGHIWADRFEGGIEDIFGLQDRVTESVTWAIVPSLNLAEIERVKRKPTESWDAYDNFLLGRAYLVPFTREANERALPLLCRSIELDPSFAAAYGWAAWCYVQRKAYNWMTDRSREITEGSRLAWAAVELGRDDPDALTAGGYALAYLAGDLDAGRIFVDRALELNPNLAMAWYSSGVIRIWLGEPEIAVEHLAFVLRLSPVGLANLYAQWQTANAYFYCGRFDDASPLAERFLLQKPDFPMALRTAAASNALAGRLEKAKEFMTRAREIDPTFRIANLKDHTNLRRLEDINRLSEGLRLAGLLD